MVAEVQIGGQSIDHHDFLIGAPSIPIRIPRVGTLSTSKVALFENDEQTGIAKMAVTAYGKDGALTASTEPTYGKSVRARRVFLMLFSWSKDDLQPDTMDE